ncbi:MAG: PKD domain-containing protein, partial [Flavobacteriales bacterium]|nr:PKD domain-containing protein [Flavobacteriales bacterium]
SLSTYVAQVGGLGQFGHAGIYEPGAAFWTVADTSFTASFGPDALVDKASYENQHRPTNETPLALTISDGSLLEQCVVAFGGGSNSFDRSEDAPFASAFRGRNNMDLYSRSDDGVDLMVNRVSDDPGLVIPILPKALNGTELTLTVDRVPDHVCLTIEDIETGWSAPVNADLSYTFTTLSNNAVHRFNLIVGGGVEASALDAACESAMNGSISVSGPDAESTFYLVDAEGNEAGTVTADSIGGTFTGLAMGTYTVTAISEGCADLNRTVEVGAGGSGTAPFMVEAMPDHIGCYDDHGGVTLEVEGGLEPYSVNWSHGGAGLTIEVEEAGILHAVITDAAGCSDSTSVEVLAAPQVSAGIFVQEPVVTLIDGEAEVYFDNISTGATGYQWNFGDGGSSVSENPIHAYTAAGAYTVGLNAWNDYCSDTYQMVVTVETVSSVGGFSSSMEPTIQRTAQGWEVAHPQEAFHVEVFDLTGRMVHRTQGMMGQPVLLDPAVMPTVSLVHWIGSLTGQQKTWRVAH